MSQNDNKSKKEQSFVNVEEKREKLKMSEMENKKSGKIEGFALPMVKTVEYNHGTKQSLVTERNAKPNIFQAIGPEDEEVNQYKEDKIDMDELNQLLGGFRNDVPNVHFGVKKRNGEENRTGTNFF